MIVTDYFMKWLEARLSPARRPMTVVEALVPNFFCCI
jgi:hypothetical protein